MGKLKAGYKKPVGESYTKAEKAKAKKWLDEHKGVPKNLEDLKEWVLEAGTLVPSLGDTSITGRKISRSSLCMTIVMGTAGAKDGTEYTIRQIIGGGVQVTNHKNSKDFRLSLSEILNLAICKGIDSKDPIPNPSDPDEVALLKELGGK